MRATQKMLLAALGVIGSGGSYHAEPPVRWRSPRRKYRFRHVYGNAELEAQLAEARRKAAAQGPHEAAAIEEAEAKRERRRQRRQAT